MQPTPNVTRKDVERIARREFPEFFTEAMAVLEEYTNRERDRVQVAVLKLAAGSMQELRRYIEWAKCDWRDVLGPAEYPGYGKKMFRIEKFSLEEKQKIINADWKQYSDWLAK